MKFALYGALGLATAAFLAIWIAALTARKLEKPAWRESAVGFLTIFFDTLGIGCFATTTAFFKIWSMVSDEFIPGTLMVGITTPSLLQAFIFIAVVEVDLLTLMLMIAGSALGAWLGAGVVSSLPRLKIRLGMGTALAAAAILMALSQLHFIPAGGDRLGLAGAALVFAVLVNVVLGALMTLGIGLYAPCMILVSLLGMSPRAAFPIMMGSCAGLMAVGSIPFIRSERYNVRAALGLTIAGIPAVLLAAFVVKELPLTAIRWLVVAVVIYTAAVMLRSALTERRATFQLSRATSN